jgi:hypothetical protein
MRVQHGTHFQSNPSFQQIGWGQAKPSPLFLPTAMKFGFPWIHPRNTPWQMFSTATMVAIPLLKTKKD